MWIWEIFVAVWEFLMAIGNILASAFWIALFVTLMFSEQVRRDWTQLIKSMQAGLHMHIYRDKNGWVRHNWGGIMAYRKERRCRCGATKVKVRGLLE